MKKINTSKFHVIAVHSNSAGFRARIGLMEKFKAHMKATGANLIVVETAFGDKPFEVTERDHRYHLQNRSMHELWLKECMINRGIEYLTQIHPDWEYMAWIDGDITFTDPKWVRNTIIQLQRYQVVQLWENAIDLGPDGQTLATHYSFMSQYVKGKPYIYHKKYHYQEAWHPGYAWAANRAFFGGCNGFGGVGQLMDTAILGAGDNHMAHGLIGMIDSTLPKGLHPAYVTKLRNWQAQADRYARRDVGYVPGTILAGFHGRKSLRGYHNRWKILVDNKYDPDIDIKRDEYGLYQLVDHGVPRSIKLRDDIRAYFRSRNEDSIDLV